MNFLIRAMRHGRVYETFSRDYSTAVVSFEALSDAGYSVELWKGAEKLR